MSSVHYSSEIYNADYTGQREVDYYEGLSETLPTLPTESSSVYTENLHPSIIVTQEEDDQAKTIETLYDTEDSGMPCLQLRHTAKLNLQVKQLNLHPTTETSRVLIQNTNVF